jgi:hypothetical protein
MAKSRKPVNWSPGDLFYSTRLKKQTGGFGGWVYLPGEHLAAALHGSNGKPDRIDIENLVAQRTVLDPGTGQILIRLRKA